MYYVYVLTNHAGRFYIGYTHDLKQHVARHNAGHVYSTHRIGGKWKLIYYEACENEIDAKKRERCLKSGHGYAYLKQRLRHALSPKSTEPAD